MTRGLGIVGAAFVVALALAPKSADAQQISACVNNSSGTIHIVAPDGTCSSNEVKLVWGGALAGADYTCHAVGEQITPNAPLIFDRSITNSFGSAIGTPGTQPFTSFTLQRGIYQIHLSGTRFTLSAQGVYNNIISATLNGIDFADWFVTASVDALRADIVGGDRLVSVAADNTTLQIINNGDGGRPVFVEGFCELVITKLQ